jgi:hypothetical protein
MKGKYALNALVMASFDQRRAVEARRTAKKILKTVKIDSCSGS